MMHKSKFWFAIVLVCFAFNNSTSVAVAEIIPFDESHWNLENAKIVDHLDRTCLMGYAQLNEVDFTNGIIEFDIAISGARSYPGIYFRMIDAGNYEHFYIRPHRVGLYPDALQYTPCFNGVGGWQLYNGNGFTNSIDMPKNEWVHVKLEIKGTQARVFINNSPQPNLVIYELKHGAIGGAIAVAGQMNQSAYFSNFSYQSDNNLEFTPPPFIEPLPGVLNDWQLSQPFTVNQVDMETYPDNQIVESIQWRSVVSEKNGLVDVARYMPLFENQPSIIIAKTTLQADENETVQLLFGYSDYITIFVNGKLSFYGNSAYQSRDPSFLGIVGYYDGVHFPVSAGENEILIMVAESFGGCGFMLRDAHAVYSAGLSQAWEIKRTLRMPESAVYDHKRDVVFISNFDRYSAPGQQFISKIKPDGTIEALHWVDGLVLPLGLAIYKDKLYVVERQNIAVIDLKSAQIINRYLFPSPGFPNDITVDDKGIAYATDSRTGTIYRLKDGKVEAWLSDAAIRNPNGIYVDGSKLYIGTSADHAIKIVDTKTKMITTLVTFGEGIMDGIRPDGKGNLLISHYEGRIYRIGPNGEKTKLLYVPESRTADFEFIPETGMFIIPSLEMLSVMGYRME